MKKASLISTVFVLLLCAQSHGELPSWLEKVEILPPNPTSSDAVTITLSGEWGDTCYPNDSNISTPDSDIYFDAIRNYPGLYCFPICCFWWEQTESVGPLAAGTYTVNARVVHPLAPPPAYEPVAEFTVTATTYYVDAVDGNDNNNGLTPETAFATIQKGIDTALDGDTVIVQPGSYIENIDFLGKNITLTSTNPPDESTVASTVIDGNHANSVVTFSGTESSACVLTGFTITNGYAIEGGGICGNGTMATIKNNIIRNNVAEKLPPPLIPQSYGAGLYDCDGLVQDNIITGNMTGYMGHGGGLYDCDGTIRRNVISDNAADCGGGLSRCDGLILNNLLVGNFAVEDGAIGYCNGTIGSCTVVGNNYRGLKGCTGTITNCIIWKNDAAGSKQLEDCNTPSYSCIENWLGVGIGNISADPCFVRTGHWELTDQGGWWRWEWKDDGSDYHLQSGAGRWNPNSQSWVIDANTSLCIDAGNPGCPPGDEPAPNGNRINMGAYGGTGEASKSPPDWALLADLTNDRKVDFSDLGVFADYWPDSGKCLPSDLDRNGTANFKDYCMLALQWAETVGIGPGMTYQIEDCDLGAAALFLAEQSESTRFTVTVEGQYIHFEDMMVANCCPDELGLEMTVEDNLITLYETEYTPGGCWCICDYPITATLGPFEPGTYTLEVYEDWGGFIGRTIVTIGSGP